MRTAAIAALLVVAPLSHAGTFAPAGAGRYVYTGHIEQADVSRLKKLAEDGQRFEVVIESNGGDLMAGIALGDYTRTIDWQVTVTVRRALSAAALWTVGDRDWHYENDDAVVGWHLPWYADADGGPKRQSASQYTMAAYWMGSYLDRVLGRAVAEPLMARMAVLRDLGEEGDKVDVNWFYVWTRDGGRRFGHWDAGKWSWLASP